MARLTFPDDRSAFRPARNGQPLRSAAGAPITVYLDPAASQVANDLLTVDGTPIVAGALTADAWSLLPLFQGPDDGRDVLYVVVDGGPVTTVYARVDDRLDALSAQITALTSSSSSGTTAEQSARIAADAAETSARSAADAAEQAARLAADATDDTRDAAEQSARIAADAAEQSTRAAAVAAEAATRAQAVTDEANARIAAVTAEQARALAAEAANAASIASNTSAMALKAPLASPALTGTPTVNGAPVETTTHAAGAYQPLVAPTVVLLGNSRVDRETISGTPSCASMQGVFGVANAICGGRFSVVNYAGVSGQLLADYIARFATAVTPYAPDFVYIADAVNDATNNRTAAQMQADYQTLIGLCRSIGARVILPTSPPNGFHTSAQRRALNDVNRWIRWQTLDGLVTPVDLAIGVTDPSTGKTQSPYSNDDLHQNQAGAARQARILAPVLATLAAPTHPLFAPVDSGNFIPSGNLYGAVGAGLPSGWVSSGTGTFSTVARADAIPGTFGQADSTAAAGTTFISRTTADNLPAGLAVGDTVRYAAEVQLASVTSLGFIDLTCQFRDAGGAATINAKALGQASGDAAVIPVADRYGVDPLTLVFISPPCVIPALTTQFRIINSVNGQCIWRLGRVALWKP